MPAFSIFRRLARSPASNAASRFASSAAERGLSCASAALRRHGTALNLRLAPFHSSGWHSSAVISRTFSTLSKSK